MGVYKITYSNAVADDLKSLAAHERSPILDEIEVQLAHEPGRETRNRKILVGLVPPWEHVSCLGVADWRVPSLFRYRRQGETRHGQSGQA